MRQPPRKPWQIEEAKRRVRQRKPKQVKGRSYEPHRGPCPKMEKPVRAIRHTQSSRDKCRTCGAQVVCDTVPMSGGRIVLLNPVTRDLHKHQNDGPPIIPEKMQ